MNDLESGTAQGLMMALLVCEKNKKHPQAIQPEITQMLRNVSITIADRAIDRIAVDVRCWEKQNGGR